MRASTRRSSAGREAAEDEWWAQGGGGRGGGCFGGRDFGDDDATLARAAQWQRDNPDLAERQAEFFHMQPLGRPGRRRGEGGAAGARALA